MIADEPTTSLDVIVEAKFLDLLQELQKEFGLTILLITHNIGVVAEVADRVAVMYAAKMAEVGEVNDVFADPKHPYTQGLLKSVPNIRLDEDELYKMGGAPPNLLSPARRLPIQSALPSCDGCLQGRGTSVRAC